jgi:hypothetical protein
MPATRQVARHSPCRLPSQNALRADKRWLAALGSRRPAAAAAGSQPRAPAPSPAGRRRRPVLDTALGIGRRRRRTESGWVDAGETQPLSHASYGFTSDRPAAGRSQRTLCCTQPDAPLAGVRPHRRDRYAPGSVPRRIGTPSRHCAPLLPPVGTHTRSLAISQSATGPLRLRWPGGSAHATTPKCAAGLSATAPAQRRRGQGCQVAVGCTTGPQTRGPARESAASGCGSTFRARSIAPVPPPPPAAHSLTPNPQPATRHPPPRLRSRSDLRGATPALLRVGTHPRRWAPGGWIPTPRTGPAPVVTPAPLSAVMHSAATCASQTDIVRRRRRGHRGCLPASGSLPRGVASHNVVLAGGGRAAVTPAARVRPCAPLPRTPGAPAARAEFTPALRSAG